MALALLPMAACSTEKAAVPGSEESTSAPTSMSATTQDIGECGRVIPTSVVDGLGWSTGESPGEGLGGCAWEGSEGLIAVSSEAGSLDAACARLEQIKRAVPTGAFEAAITVPGGERACAYVRERGLGMSQLYLVDKDGRVIGIRVAALVSTKPERVRAALLELAESAPDVS